MWPLGAVDSEDLLDRANSKSNIDTGAIDEMLRTKFFSGLRPGLRDVAHHKFDTIKSFDKLRIEMRKIEAENRCPKNPPDVKPKPQVKMVDVELKSEFGKLQGTVHNLVDKFGEFQKQVDLKMAGNSQNVSQGFNQGYNQGRGQHSNRGQYRGRGHGYGKSRGRGHSPYQSGNVHSTGNDQKAPGTKEPIKCYRCGQEGHVKSGCRVDLNSLKSTATGQP